MKLLEMSMKQKKICVLLLLCFSFFFFFDVVVAVTKISRKQKKRNYCLCVSFKYVAIRRVKQRRTNEKKWKLMTTLFFFLSFYHSLFNFKNTILNISFKLCQVNVEVEVIGAKQKSKQKKTNKQNQKSYTKSIVIRTVKKMYNTSDRFVSVKVNGK